MKDDGSKQLIKFVAAAIALSLLLGWLLFAWAGVAAPLSVGVSPTADPFTQYAPSTDNLTVRAITDRSTLKVKGD